MNIRNMEFTHKDPVHKILQKYNELIEEQSPQEKNIPLS